MGAQAESSASGPGRSTASISSTSKSSRKRKLPSNWSDADAANYDNHRAIPYQVPEQTPKKCHKKEDPNEEKRLRRFRPKAPQNFHEVYQRATSQRFYVLGRRRAGTAWCPEEFVELTGSTGNIYVVHIAQQPTCTCPHNKAGHQCKHIFYVLSRVLRAPFDLVYQLALLSTELVSIFENAPPAEVGDDATKPKEDKNRKDIEGDCPICFMPFEGEDATVYCRAQCGQNIHKECFEMWAATKRQNRNATDKVTCPMCRTPWQGDDDMQTRIRNTGVVGAEGYVNIADKLGISTYRDTSTYYNGPRRGVPYRPWGYW